MAVAVAETPVTGTLEGVDGGGLLVPRRLPLRSNGTRLETLSVSTWSRLRVRRLARFDSASLGTVLALQPPGAGRSHQASRTPRNDFS